MVTALEVVEVAEADGRPARYHSLRWGMLGTAFLYLDAPKREKAIVLWRYNGYRCIVVHLWSLRGGVPAIYVFGPTEFGSGCRIAHDKLSLSAVADHSARPHIPRQLHEHDTQLLCLHHIRNFYSSRYSRLQPELHNILQFAN